MIGHCYEAIDFHDESPLEAEPGSWLPPQEEDSNADDLGPFLIAGNWLPQGSCIFEPFGVPLFVQPVMRNPLRIPGKERLLFLERHHLKSNTPLSLLPKAIILISEK